MTQNNSQSPHKQCRDCRLWFDRATFPRKSARCKECLLARARELSRRPDQVQKRKDRRANRTEEQREAAREKGRLRFANRTAEQKQQDYEYRRARREIDNARARELRRQSPDRKARQSYSVWKSNLKHQYGITPAIHEMMYREQGGKCYFCDVPKQRRGRGGKALVVDHDHEAGSVRGLLCRSCNAGWVDRYRRLPKDLQDSPRTNAYLRRGNGEYIGGIKRGLASAS